MEKIIKKYVRKIKIDLQEEDKVFMHLQELVREVEQSRQAAVSPSVTLVGQFTPCVCETPKPLGFAPVQSAGYPPIITYVCSNCNGTYWRKPSSGTAG